MDESVTDAAMLKGIEVTEASLIQIILQISGLAPYRMGMSLHNTYLNKYLVTYSLILAALVLANVIYSEIDPANNGAYSNKTIVVDLAYDTVDWLGNIYVATCIFFSIPTYKRSCVIFFEVKQMDKKYEAMGIKFDAKKKRNYFIIKMLLMLICSSVVMSMHIYLEIDTGNIYTKTYWICVLHPKLYATVVVMVFGSCSLNIYRKLWVINQLLQTIMEEYTMRSNHKKICESLPKNFDFERTLEKMIFQQQISSPNLLLNKNNKIHPNIEEKKAPYVLFLLNYPECFQKENRNFYEELHMLRRLHFEVLEFGANINVLYGVHFLFLFILYFLGVIINVYAAVTFHVKDQIGNEYATCIIWILQYIAMVIYLVNFCNISISEGRKTTSILFKFLATVNREDVIVKEELRGFALQSTQSPIEFSACGFFCIDAKLLFAFVVGVISNVIFIVQFDKLNLQEVGAKGDSECSSG